MADILPQAFIGAAVAHKAPVRTLKLAVSWILVVAAIFLLGKLIYENVHISPMPPNATSIPSA